MMPKSLLGLLVPLFMVSPAYARSLAEIKKSGELRICISLANNTPDYTGVDKVVFDISNEFAKTLGVKPNVSKVEWDDQFFDDKGKIEEDAVYTPKLLETGKCDFYPSNLTKNEWRLKKMDFVTLFPNRMMIVVQKSKLKQYKSLTDLGGKTCITENASSWHSWMEEQNKGALAATPVKLQFAKPQEAFNAVDEGKADFTINDSDAAMAASRRLKKSAVAFPVGAMDEIGWAFRKKDKDLQEAAKKFFDAQRSDKASVTNTAFKREYGLSLVDFVSLVTQVR